MKWAVTSIIIGIAIIFGAWSPLSVANDKWPDYVKATVSIPKEANQVRSKEATRGVFHVSYRAEICYPAKTLIDQTRTHMTKKGWIRLDYDLFNPEVELTSNYPLVGGGWQGYPWLEYWKDTAGNIVTYEYAFDMKRSGSQEQTGIHNRPCDLRGTVDFYTRDGFKRIKERFDIERERVLKEERIPGKR